MSRRDAARRARMPYTRMPWTPMPYTRMPWTRPRAGADTGMTLIELMVSLTVMSVFMTIFTSGVIQMYRAANKDEAASTAQSQVNLAFLRLDKEIRYAAGLSAPDLVGADPYVEYLTTNTGAAVCTELRLHLANGQLQRRTWTRGAVPVTPTPWIPLASGVSSATPFTVSAADPTYNFQRLRLALTATSGKGGTAVSKQSDVTFTALNTSLGTSSATLCTEGRDVP